MPVTTTKNGIAITDQLMFNTDVDETEDVDVFAGAATIHSLRVDNSAGKAWVKLYDATTVSVGTTDPDYILQADPSETLVWTIVDGFSMTNVTIAATNSAGTAGNTTPAGTVKVHAVAR